MYHTKIDDFLTLMVDSVSLNIPDVSLYNNTKFKQPSFTAVLFAQFRK